MRPGWQNGGLFSVSRLLPLLGKSAPDGEARRAVNPAVLQGRDAVPTPEQTTEGPQADKADFQADVRYRQLGLAQQVLGHLQPAQGQILVGRHGKELLEQAQKMMRRKAGDLRDLSQIQRL